MGTLELENIILTGLWVCEASLCGPPKELGTLLGDRILSEMVGRRV